MCSSDLPTPLISLRIVVLASDPSVCISYQVRAVSIWPFVTTLVLILILVLILNIATMSIISLLLVLGFVCGSVLISTRHDFANCKGNTLIQALLHATQLPTQGIVATISLHCH